LQPRDGRLEPAAVSWLQRLVSDWHLVADLSFADLLLWIPDPDGSRLCVGAQARPTTGPTAYSDDLVGQMLPAAARPLVVRALETGVISRDGDPQWRDTVPVRLEAIPVRHDDTVIAVIARSTNMLGIRMPSRLELAYLQAATDLAVMISEGTFPSLADRTDLPSLPRVGDGMLRLDPAGVVTYASPNALSAYRRFGFAGNLLGSHLGRVTARLAPSDSATDEALSGMVSGESFRATEIDSPDGTLVVRSLPLTRRRERIGALVLVRDVTDLRSRERELLSKDATIREIHHRVKNNLQTVAALLRLQARRTQAPEARSALQEAVRPRRGPPARPRCRRLGAGGHGDTDPQRFLRDDPVRQGHPAGPGPHRTAAQRRGARSAELPGCAHARRHPQPGDAPGRHGPPGDLPR
jgi:hypothetical protein